MGPESEPIPRYIDEGEDALLDKILQMLEELDPPEESAPSTD